MYIFNSGRLQTQTVSKNKRSSPAFTIVELLIVIVIIGILAAITIVSYVGISQRAISASLQSDLDGASRQLKLFQVTNGLYPTTIDCSQSDSTTNKCLKASSGNSYTIYSPNNSSPQSFSLTETNMDGITYRITDGSVPVVVNSYNWSSIAAGNEHGCALTAGGVVYCWGYNYYGGLGNGNNSNSNIPVAVSTSGVLSGKTIKSISNGGSYTCAIASDDKAYCWGYGGALGNGTNSNSNIPVAVSTSGVLSGKTIKSISAGEWHTCAIASDDQVYCWGLNSGNGSGELGNNSTVDSNVPVAVNTSGVLSGKTIKSISAGEWHTCAIASDDQVYCWGANAAGELGNNSNTNSPIPVAVNTSGVLNGKTIKSISVETNSCAIASDNQAYCWGWDIITNGYFTSTLVPTLSSNYGILNGKTINSISVGGYMGCAIASDNQAYCWGANVNGGQLGNNSIYDTPTPAAVNTSGVLNGLTMKYISVGLGTNVCAIASDNQVYCWGNNSSGTLGDNSTTNRHVPVALYLP